MVAPAKLCRRGSFCRISCLTSRHVRKDDARGAYLPIYYTNFPPIFSAADVKSFILPAAAAFRLTKEARFLTFTPARESP
jgi:hypothetical protein